MGTGARAHRDPPPPQPRTCPRTQPRATSTNAHPPTHTASHNATRIPFQVRLGAEPPPTAGGYPLRTLPEATEVLLKPKMYYELQRGVKKLRF